MTSYLVAPERWVTSEFVLRSWAPGDGELKRRAVSESYDHLVRWMPWPERDESPEEAERLVRTFRARWLLAEDFVVGVFSPDGSRVLGGTGFHLRLGAVETANAEIGLWIHAAEAGRGLGTRVLIEMLKWGFSAWPWQRLQWLCDDRNLASARVAEKAGMLREAHFHNVGIERPEGLRRDEFLYAAQRGVWQPPR